MGVEVSAVGDEDVVVVIYAPSVDQSCDSWFRDESRNVSYHQIEEKDSFFWVANDDLESVKAYQFRIEALLTDLVISVE